MAKYLDRMDKNDVQMQVFEVEYHEREQTQPNNNKNPGGAVHARQRRRRQQQMMCTLISTYG